MAASQPHVRPRLTARIAHPGVLAVIAVGAVVLLWDTFVIHTAAPPLGVLVVAQVALLALSYRWPVPALAACTVLMCACDAAFPTYSDYSLYGIVTALGLWAYRTGDAAAAGAVAALAAYQFAWLAVTGAAPARGVLFAAMFALVALLGCSLRHVIARLRRQRAQMARMREEVRRNALDLHDAVAGRLTEVDLLLQRRELELSTTSTAGEHDDELKLDRHIRTQLDGIATDVAQIVDLLLEQTHQSPKGYHSGGS
ncbi:MAG: hypothetical protein UHD09_03720 [Bifidobacterium sp.]|nr:hypothetical protein [Bifidobacterium sp.]